MFTDIDSPISTSIDHLRKILLDDLYWFFFYSLGAVNNISPDIPEPVGRISHFRLMADKVMAAMRGEVSVLAIATVPRYGKSEFMCAAVAWCYAHNPAGNNIYGSHKKNLATVQTENIRKILQSRFFQTLFDARISKSSSAKDNFETVQGGRTISIGADGSGLGYGAGLTGDVPYGGAIILDDMFKATEVHSKTIRNNVQRLYSGTLVNRRNNPKKTPIIVPSQRTHQEDLIGMLLNGVDGQSLDIYQKEWNENALIIAGLDDADNALWPEKHSKEYFHKLRDEDPYTYWAMIQQEPISPANRIFNSKNIFLTKKEPKIIVTFVTVDTAETADRVNDASVFSFWGVYQPEFMGAKTGDLAIHWLSCYEVRVDPADLVGEFELFWGGCLRHRLIPGKIFIEKKSTGGMLIDFLKQRQGLMLLDIKRDAGTGSKTERFHRVAPYVSRGLVSMDEDCQHLTKCIRQVDDITFEESQKHDDRVDTMADAIQLALIDKIIYNDCVIGLTSEKVKKVLALNRQRRLAASNSYGRRL